ncbi:TPR-like protein [Lactarius akahatsu]|uniref:TPR-like protein n=1 Tax=Lactarius akahatsu TaxID=416441 RepID=A0AAD4L414_9AGAM|nr:TPR-like protein [Lactarius akahatsu]
MSFDGEQLQRSLLDGQWREQAGDPSQNVIAQLCKQVLDGDFKAALFSPLARSMLTLNPEVLNDLSQPITSWFDFSAPSAGGDYEEELVHLLTAIACLHAFLQANWTGPDLDPALDPPLSLLLPDDNKHPTLTAETLQHKAVCRARLRRRASVPPRPRGLLFRLALLLLFARPFHHARSAHWWRVRAWAVHQQLLAEPVPVPRDPRLVGRLWLERGLLEHHVTNDRAALECFVKAARATGLRYELTGRAGETHEVPADGSHSARAACGEHAAGWGDARRVGQTAAGDSRAQRRHAPGADRVHLVGSHDAGLAPRPPGPCEPAAPPPTRPMHLPLALPQRPHTSPVHGLTTEQMSPYVARVISHPENWSVHTMALLLRSRLEAHRTRTVERATLQLQALLERELARRFLALGVVKSALEIFERLEMWEEAVRCWQAIERRDTALNVVRDLLAGRREEADAVCARGKAASGQRRDALDAAREARLWCLLGELEPERSREHFERAWEVSRETSGRAMRSLGGHHFARDEYAEAAQCLRRAVAINPLYVRSWFVLGCACIREQDWEGAREAFVRCVTIDDEDAESWNNLASVYLRMGNEKEIPFENKMLAFRALKQGLKFHYENWRMWTNYAIVAMDVGELSEACRALGRVVEERAAKVGAESVDADVLDRLVAAATRAPPEENSTPSPNEGGALLRRVEDLFVRVLLPRVSSPRIFRARARLLVAQGRLPEALDAYLEAYRAGVASQMEAGETDVERWREGVREVEEVCGVLVNYGPKVEGSRWTLQARSIVRTFMGRTKDFEDEPEWSRLVELLDDFKK